MPKAKLNKRMRLIQSAVKLTHRHGFRTTSLADIAEEAKVPVGNVYYYFKTKDEIGEAIVQQRLLEFRALQQECDKALSPKERLVAFGQNTFANRDVLVRSGCPFGTLYSELHKEGGGLASKADALFSEPLAWLEEQFRAAGQGRRSGWSPFQCGSQKKSLLLRHAPTASPTFRAWQTTSIFSNIARR
jgi:AcrR family transcriptional regulator